MNPIARRGAQELLETLRRCAGPDAVLTVHETSPEPMAPGELEDEAARHDVVVAIGGDGTVGEALNAMGAADVPLGIIPGGSTNIIARESRIPFNPELAARTICGAHDLLAIDTPICNGVAYLHIAGAGFDSLLFDLTDSRLKHRYGWLAYLPSAAQALKIPPALFRIETASTSVEVESPLVLVANGPGIISPRLPVFTGISSTDGMLDVVAITATSLPRILGVVGNFVARRLDRSRHVLHLRTPWVRIESTPAMPIELDGNVYGRTPMDVSLRPTRARLIVPRR